MAIADRVKDTSSTTGTGAITLSGTPPTGFQNLAAIGTTGTTFPYLLENTAAGEWECGTGTITGANTFSRSVTSSSNGGSLVNFTAGPVFQCVLTVNELLNGVQKLTNKRIKPRVLALGSGATPAVNTDLYDRVHITGLAVAITGFTMSGTPDAGDQLAVEITDNGTARAISWGASFESSTVAVPNTTVAGQRLTVYFEYNATASKWRCVGYA